MVLRDRRRAMRTVAPTSRHPNTSAENLQPNEFIPNSCSPTAISHLPSCGWTTNEGLAFHPSTLPAAIVSSAPAAHTGCARSPS